MAKERTKTPQQLAAFEVGRALASPAHTRTQRIVRRAVRVRGDEVVFIEEEIFIEDSDY